MSRKKIVSSIGILLLLFGIGSVAFLVRGEERQEEKKSAEQEQQEQQGALPLEEARSDDLDVLDESRSSWPGELISYSTVEAHSLSEGILTDLRVRIGQGVAKGETIASLSAPPASIERAEAAAERVEMLVKAQANAKTTEKIVAEQIAQLKKAKESLAPSRETSVALSQKETELARQKESNTLVELEQIRKEKDASVALAVKERDRARTKLDLGERELQTLLEQIIDQNLSDFTANSTNYTPLTYRAVAKTENVFIRYKYPTITNERFEYQRALFSVMKDLEAKSSAVDSSALVYGSALLNYSRTLVSDDDILSMRDVERIKENARMQQMNIVKLVNEIRDSRSMIEAKDAELKKMVTEREKEITISELMIKNSRIESENAAIAKKKTEVESQFEYLNRKREIDIKIIELKRELELARAEVKAAQAAYETFTRELASQRIVAQKGGVVTAIQKNVGDFVNPDDVIAVISSGEQDSVFVRFRLPNDVSIPDAGTEVIVTRPGFPFEKKEAVITGTGTSLSEGEGTYIGEAEFIEDLGWPVHALVRVSLKEKKASVYVPFTAIRWDEERNASLRVAAEDGSFEDRIVITGRAIGDRIEIIEGLSVGEQYVSDAFDDAKLKGQKITRPSSEEEEGSSGEGHGGHGE